MLTTEQAQQLIRAYTSINHLSQRLEQMKLPTNGTTADAYRPPRTPGPTPPCNLTWVDFDWQLTDMLARTAAQARTDIGNLYGLPVRTLSGYSGWLHGIRDHLINSEWINSETWLAHQYETEPNEHTMASLTISYASYLQDALEPPLNGRPAGTALEVAWETGIPVATIRSWGQRGRVPRFKGPQGAWLYRVNDVLSLKSRRPG